MSRSNVIGFLLIVGAVLVAVPVIASLAYTPHEWYPVRTFRSTFAVGPDGTTVQREGRDSIHIPLPAGLSVAKEMQVTSEVSFERPLPLVSKGRSGWQHLDEQYRQPTQDQIDAAGPQRAVTVRLVGHTGTSNQFSEAAKLPSLADLLTLYVWPYDPAVDVPMLEQMKTVELPQDIRKIVLLALPDEILWQSGDAQGATAAGLGGTPRVPLPALWKMPAFGLFQLCGFGLLVGGAVLKVVPRSLSARQLTGGPD